MLYKHLVVPIDGSPTSLAAVDAAVPLARAFGSTVTVIYVIEGPTSEPDSRLADYLSAARAYGPTPVEDPEYAEAASALEEAAKRFAAESVTAETRTVVAEAPWRGILDTVESTNASLIVIGSHGRRGLRRLVLGSVTQNVMMHTETAMLVVRGTE